MAIYIDVWPISCRQPIILNCMTACFISPIYIIYCSRTFIIDSAKNQHIVIHHKIDCLVLKKNTHICGDIVGVFWSVRRRNRAIDVMRRWKYFGTISKFHLNFNFFFHSILEPIQSIHMLQKQNNQCNLFLMLMNRYSWSYNTRKICNFSN